ncbi:MAG: helix-turn-helix transcriptional regulator [Oscillospiraceae bacterium]|nr:helix-turn-helix transcriptional regulator [Oscillospiraceae bacterium]
MHFGKNLQVLRKMAGMTQEQLAEKLNVSRQTISKWEQGEALPEIEKLLELCKTFNCSLDQMLREKMDYSSERYSEIRLVTVEPFRYISYVAISREPEEDALTHVGRWAEKLNMEHPRIIGWDFPQVSQEQRNVFHMRGYGAALVLNDGQETGGIDAEICAQGRQRYVTITLEKVPGEEFTVIPNAYKALLTYMAINGIKGKHDSSIIPCYEHEYVDGNGTQLMDVYIAVE